MKCPACGLELRSRRIDEGGQDRIELQCRNPQCARFGRVQKYGIEQLQPGEEDKA